MNFLRTARFWKKTAIVLGAVFATTIIVVYFLLAPRFNENFVNEVLFHPLALTDHAAEMKKLSGVQAEEVVFPSGNGKLNALFYRVTGTPDVVLISHGNAGSIDNRIDKIQAIIDSGVSVFAYDYRGYGKSSGKPSLRGVVEDGIAAYDYLIDSKNYKPDQIVLYGESVGTGVTTEIARRRQCKAMILESGFTSPEKRAKEKLPIVNIYPSFLCLDPALDNLDYVRGKHPPLLLFAGQNDTMIPCSHSQTMFAEATDPKQLVIGPNSDHNDFSRDFPMYKKALSDFLKTNASVATESQED